MIRDAPRYVDQIDGSSLASGRARAPKAATLADEDLMELVGRNDGAAFQGRVIELAYFGGFSHAEIAAILDTPIGTIKSRMRLGQHKPRAEMTGVEAIA